MNVRARSLRKPLKEILHQFCLEIANAHRAESSIHNAVRASTEINRRHSQRFIHWHQKISRSVNPALVAERRSEGFPYRNPHVLNRMMLIHRQVASGLEFQIKPAVARNKIEHVVEKRNPR